eukprot:c3685_g1_i1.p1 GENE.c3685_g1_i1~~c3685_g1_i1.p1  ORF type:complete len:483 (-),score=101.88 c3685_g1_i1:16-1464(-)
MWALLFLASILGHYADGAASDIKHVVVIMYENRSFDHFLGYLKTESNPNIDGLTGTESNPVDPYTSSGETITVSPDAVYVGPAPGHEVPDSTLQIFGTYTPQANAQATMDGFVASMNDNAQGQGPLVMKCFNQSSLPVFQTLATEFAIFDRFYSSVPGPTEVNRMYLFSCTSHGASQNDNVQLALGYPQATMFEAVQAAGLTWRDYYSDFPTGFFLARNRAKGMIENFHVLDQFYTDAAAGTLPNLSVLEPAYYNAEGLFPATDAHPNHLVNLADDLLKRVYEALAASPQWNNTVLIVTFDEHGGFYDHVPTPLDGVPNPDGLNGTNPPFNFTRLGIRVPLIMASPWLPAGTVVHEGVGPTPTSHYDHSSIYATIKTMWGLPNFLTKRDAWASTFESVFDTLDAPRTDTPRTMPELVFQPTAEELARQAANPLSDFQLQMAYVAASLDGSKPDMAKLARLTNAQAAAMVRRKVKAFLKAQTQ